MGGSVKIITAFVLIMFLGLKGYSQVNTQKVDSLQNKERQGQTSVEGKERKGQGNAYGQVNRNNESQSVKQVKGGRPDMSRARGARPPSIVRPSGSGVPRGVGKPGGVGRKGGR